MPTTLRLTDSESAAADLDGILPTDGALIFFESVPEADAVAACDALARHRGLRLNHIDARELAAGDLLAVRGNLREAFDEMRNPAVFVLTSADALLDAPRRAADDDTDARPPAEQLALYLFDRIEAFDGIVALCTAGTAPNLDDARQRAVVVTA